MRQMNLCWKLRLNQHEKFNGKETKKITPHW